MISCSRVASAHPEDVRSFADEHSARREFREDIGRVARSTKRSDVDGTVVRMVHRKVPAAMDVPRA